jgi:hypothetical protein
MSERKHAGDPLAVLLPSAVGQADPVSQNAAATTTAAANQFVKKKNRRRPDPQLGQNAPRRILRQPPAKG